MTDDDVKDPNDKATDTKGSATRSPAERAAARMANLEEEVAILSTIVHDFITAHGETYTGALEHLAVLRGVRERRG